jgi:hypothetical protein
MKTTINRREFVGLAAGVVACSLVGSAAVSTGDYVVRLKGPSDIAVNQQPDATSGLTTDWWDGHIEKEVRSGRTGR